MILLGLTLCSLTACQTVQPTNSTLREWQEWATPEPPDRVSPPQEQRRAKQAMVRWLESHMQHEFRVINQHFVLLESGFTQGASIGSKAHQYVRDTLNGEAHTDDWFVDGDYRLVVWRYRDGQQRYLAFAMTRDFLPGTDERRLVGYFELTPSRATKSN